MPGTSATTDAVATFAYDLLTRHHDARRCAHCRGLLKVTAQVDAT